MTAKPESVESVVENALAEFCTGSHGCRICKAKEAILTAHRAEIAEALKEPTEDERLAIIQAMLAAGNRGDYLADFIAYRRRKHGVGE